jgi:DNA-binding Lrp family transcriptional regulator
MWAVRRRSRKDVRRRRSHARRAPAPAGRRCTPPGLSLRCLQSRDEEVVVAVRAYVLIQTEVGKAASVATKVAEIQGVITADDVTGPYDVIVQAESDSVDDLGKMVVSRVQLIEGITRTLTCPVVHL